MGLRQEKRIKEPQRNPFTSIAELLLPYFPDLRKKLFLADLTIAPPEFIGNVVTSTIFGSLALLLLTFIFFNQNSIELIYLFVFLVIYPVILFFYLMLYPDALISKRQKELDYEVLFAGRHLVISLKSGAPLFDSLVGVSRGDYGPVSKEFAKIVEHVSLGVPLSQAVRESAQLNPSKYLVRLLVQMSSSISSGADVGDSIDAVLDQISKEQIIKLKSYGQQLTPIVMFFMIFGIILPSLGIVLSIVLFSVISGGKLGLTSGILVLVFALIAIIQFIFLGVIETSRPKYLL
ncbi:MAG: type II secretion system F family protein [Candidatus Micrarchaeota archaeon]|nr:type II secretion system F family protein [Candidatus Micrarchaeota archaeon]